VLFNGERTLKRIHMDKEGKVQLKPDNPYMPTIHVNASDELVILGLVLGLVWRKAR
jgi:SOS-response transcriptional repressor LexA